MEEKAFTENYSDANTFFAVFSTEELAKVFFVVDC